jgi:hypothetical protein
MTAHLFGSSNSPLQPAASLAHRAIIQPIVFFRASKRQDVGSSDINASHAPLKALALNAAVAAKADVRRSLVQ